MSDKQTTLSLRAAFKAAYDALHGRVPAMSFDQKAPALSICLETRWFDLTPAITAAVNVALKDREG